MARCELSVDLTDEVVVITGGGGVLCGAMARALGARGAAVAVLDIVPEACEAQASGIRDSGGRALGVACSVLDRAELEAAAAKIV